MDRVLQLVYFDFIIILSHSTASIVGGTWGQKKHILTLLPHDLFSEYSDILATPISKLLTNRRKPQNMVGVAVDHYTNF